MIERERICDKSPQFELRADLEFLSVDLSSPLSCKAHVNDDSQGLRGQRGQTKTTAAYASLDTCSGTMWSVKVQLSLYGDGIDSGRVMILDGHNVLFCEDKKRSLRKVKCRFIKIL